MAPAVAPSRVDSAPPVETTEEKGDRPHYTNFYYHKFRIFAIFFNKTKH